MVTIRLPDCASAQTRLKNPAVEGSFLATDSRAVPSCGIAEGMEQEGTPVHCHHHLPGD
jgi:hypothetical protein